MRLLQKIKGSEQLLHQNSSSVVGFELNPRPRSYKVLWEPFLL